MPLSPPAHILSGAATLVSQNTAVAAVGQFPQKIQRTFRKDFYEISEIYA